MYLSTTEKIHCTPIDEDSTDDVVSECAQCHQPYLVKYWDKELDWYIELNLTPYCRECLNPEHQE